MLIFSSRTKSTFWNDLSNKCVLQLLFHNIDTANNLFTMYLCGKKTVMTSNECSSIIQPILKAFCHKCDTVFLEGGT